MGYRSRNRELDREGYCWRVWRRDWEDCREESRCEWRRLEGYGKGYG